jgi:DNA-binding Xre family transcriptional regulator
MNNENNCSKNLNQLFDKIQNQSEIDKILNMDADTMQNLLDKALSEGGSLLKKSDSDTENYFDFFESGTWSIDEVDNLRQYFTVATMAKKIEILLIEMGLDKKELAARLGTTPSNISDKLKRDNFSESELHEIAKACNATFTGIFIINDSGKVI